MCTYQDEHSESRNSNPFVLGSSRNRTLLAIGAIVHLYCVAVFVTELLATFLRLKTSHATILNRLALLGAGLPKLPAQSHKVGTALSTLVNHREEYIQ